MTLLQVKTSIFGDAGQSSRLADAFVARRRATEPGTEIIVRDLARDPVPHLTAERFGAFIADPEARTEEQRAVVAASDVLIAELKRADTIVLGLPMYNFGIPSVLKAYFDHIARAGVTFRYTEKGPVGMLTGKKAYAFATRGGRYAGTPRDLQTAYVRDFLGFLGITDVEFVYAEGLAISDASRQAALAKAALEIDRLGMRERVAA
ncbi:MAG TPA: NAD(P)H-dependent oxidoreductase [Casimicrobiaceae bacterium]|nr:NAD(P)H-dependent oxidoreductase [Casimicrobiaceae bacterium]